MKFALREGYKGGQYDGEHLPRVGDCTEGGLPGHMASMGECSGVEIAKQWMWFDPEERCELRLAHLIFRGKESSNSQCPGKAIAATITTAPPALVFLSVVCSMADSETS